MKTLMTFASALALAACSTGPDYERPEVRSAAAGQFVAASSPSVDTLAPVPANWWRLYKDPVLDGLIVDALAHNTDVRAAVARLARARASLREVKVNRLPQGGVSASATKGRDAGIGDASTSYSAGLEVAYEVDLFGRVSRGVEATRGIGDDRHPDSVSIRFRSGRVERGRAAGRRAAHRRTARPVAQAY